jgi:hypothetical protein
MPDKYKDTYIGLIPAKCGKAVLSNLRVTYATLPVRLTRQLAFAANQTSLLLTKPLCLLTKPLCC